MQRATAAALNFNADITRSALASSLDALSFALEAATFRSPNQLIEASARHADRQYRCLEAQSDAYGALVDWALDEMLVTERGGAAPARKLTPDEAAAEQEDDEALLLKLME